MASAPRFILSVTLLACLPMRGAGPVGSEVRTVAAYRDAGLGLEIVKGELLLPAGGPWPMLVSAPGETGLAQVQLVPPPSAGLTARILREREAEVQQAASSAGYRVSGDYLLRQALERYAKAHDGLCPQRLDEPGWLQAVAQGPENQPVPPPPYASGSPRQQRLEAMRRTLEGYAILPGVPFQKAPETQKARQPLLVEVAPTLADGRHWVLDNMLMAQRRSVDPKLLAAHGLKLSQERVVRFPPLPDPKKPLAFTVLALRRDHAKVAHLQLLSPTGPPTDVNWTFSKPPVGTRELLSQWAAHRALGWQQGSGELSPLVPHFRAAQARAYGVPEEPPGPEVPDFRRGGPSLLSLFGGRAAVEETLQLDRTLGGRLDTTASKPRVPISAIQGIPVASHPWKQMLGAKRIETPGLLDCVPEDRALLYLPNPREVLDEFSNGGARFLSRVNALARQGSLDHDLVARAQEDLALGGGLGRRLLEAGAIREAAVFMPDLALLSGSGLTVILELVPSAAPLLAFVAGETPRAVKTPRGEAWWARSAHRFFASTSRSEVERALALHRAGGEGSLGRSDEFQVMLGKLAPTADTRAFFYLSDPFIRQLLGPARRIQQLRRARARGLMEELAAAAELRRQDAPGASLDPRELQRLCYLREDFPLGDTTVDEQGAVSSSQWGPLARMRRIEADLTEVEAWEAEAYQVFRDGYRSYWRRFFDPIALRLDAEASGGYSLETFILPLLDHGAYRELRNWLSVAPAPKAQPTPLWGPPMVAELAFDAPWAKAANNLVGRSTKGLGVPIPPELFDQLEPRLHVAFLDAAPVVQLGGGSPFGLMDVGSLGAGNQMLLFAPLLGALTRPMAVAIPVKDPEAVRRMLAELGRTGLQPQRQRELEWRTHQEADGRTVLSLTLLGAVTLRWSLHLEGPWLVATNDTSLASPLVLGSGKTKAVHGTLALRPGEIKAGLSAAWLGFVESEARAAWAAQRWLAPWLNAGLPLAEALGASRRIFGAAPELVGGLGPGPIPVNLRFGSPQWPRLPEREAGKDFGLFEGIHQAVLDLTFEEDGLRTLVRWAPAGSAK